MGMDERRGPKLVSKMTTNPRDELEEYLGIICKILRELRGKNKEEEGCAMAS